MNLIFIYGPPATGKLTVAKELSKLTGYPIFHNHLTRDLVGDIFPDSLDKNYGLVATLRKDIMAYCAANGHSLIFTYVYDGPDDDAVLGAMVRAVTDNGGSVRFVELGAPREVLLQRVADESRKAHKKLTDVTEMTDLLDRVTFGRVPYDDVLAIDTSTYSPEVAAAHIAAHYGLSLPV